MRLITRADENLFHTVTVATKLGRAKAIVDRLGARYDDDWDSVDAAFPYALAMVAVLQTSGTDFEKHAGYTDVIETLGDVLHADPDHWLARYCRARIRALIPTSYSVYRNYVVGERGKAVRDADELIERQSMAPAQPYFACTYLLAARMALEDTALEGTESGTAGDAGDGVDRAAGLIERAAALPADAVPFPALAAILCEPFVACYSQPAVPSRALVGDLMSALFPEVPAVRRALGFSSVGSAG